MKKMLWMAALTSVALAGCVNEEVAVDNPAKQRKELTFGTPVMYNQSRAVNGEITGTTYPKGENFVVFGIEHTGNFKGWVADNVLKDANGNNFFPDEGEEVTNRAGTNYWDTTTSYYLPAQEENKLSFAAYSPTRTKDSYTKSSDDIEAPNSTSVSFGADGLTITNWRMQDDPSSHYDLMSSEITQNVIQAEVPIKFYHRLASVNFQFSKPSGEGSPYAVHLKELKIIPGDEFYNMGTYKDNLTGTNTSTMGATWNILLANNIPNEYVLFSNDSKEILAADESTHANITGKFLVIPQEVNSGMKVCISYTIQQDKDGHIDEVNDKTIAFLDFVKPDAAKTTEWIMGTRYNYHIHFGALTKIFFAPEVGKDWTTIDNAGVYTISGSTTTP